MALENVLGHSRKDFLRVKDIYMKNRLFLVGLPAFAFFVFCIAFAGCGVKIVKALTPEDIQQLEDVKSLFESQMKDDMHPVIWVYLDEVLHDPDSFRLQRFEYNISNYRLMQPYEEKIHVFGSETRTKYKQVFVPAYRVLMRYRVRIPAGGMMLKKMNFYLLKDKSIRLPNGIFVSLKEQ